MLVAGFPAGPWQTNCWVLAPAAGEQCVVIDPGHSALDPLEDLLREFRLTPVAVLLTHGHLDHTWSVVPVCGARGIPAYVAPADRAQLSEPALGLGMPPGTPILGRLEWAEPDDVRSLADGETLELAGLTFEVVHTPGHTPGSVSFALPGELISGDLLFAGSIGRSDLPGGDPDAMMRSLARVCTRFPDTTKVRPGHGPDTTIGTEKVVNPFLADLRASELAAGPAPHRQAPTRPGW